MPHQSLHNGSGFVWFIASALFVVEGGVAHAQVQQPGADSSLEEIFVTGSRISRQGFDAPTPVTAIDSDYLLELGFVNVGAAVQQLPSNKASLTPETNGFGSFNVGAQIANLRALGSQRTLTLVDGRRFIASTDTANVDLNLIPPLLLERTEIVTGGASAAYGSDAVAGVINVILNKKLDGIRWQADMYETGEGDGIESCIRTRDWCKSLPGIITNPANATNGQPRNIITDHVVLANMTSAGLIVGAPGLFTAPPNPASSAARLYGLQLDAAGNPIPFAYGFPGNMTQTFQSGGDGFSRYETTNPRTPVQRASFYTHLDWHLSDTTNLFFDVSAGAVQGWNLGAARWFNGSASSILINRSNPFLPSSIAALMDGAAGTADDITQIRLGKHWDDWGRVESHSNNKVYRLVVGAEGDFSDKWSWDTYYQIGYDDRHQYLLRQPINANFARALNAVTDPGTGQPTCADLLSPDQAVRDAAAGCKPINPFGLNNWDPAARDYVLGTLHEWYKMNEWVVAANVQGEAFEVGGGPIGVAAGFETRRDDGAEKHDPCSRRSCYWQNYGDDFVGNLTVLEAYAETAIPFVRDKRGAKLFELDGALRQTHYKNNQPEHLEYYNNGTVLSVAERDSTIDATTFKFSALYDPTDWLRFRVTRSHDIRAPNFSELYERVESLGFTGFANPWTGATDTPLVASTGNVNMSAEEGDTNTFGVVFSPNWKWGSGFRLSVDLWDIDIHGAIARLGAASLIDGCFRGNQTLCGFIDGYGPNGRMTSIRNPYLNLDSYKTSGVDLEALYQFDLRGGAKMAMRVFATRTDEVAIKTAGVVTDYAGVTGPQAFGQPRWAWNSSVNYDRDKWGLSVQIRYIDSGLYNPSWIDPSDPRYAAALTSPTLGPLTVNDNTIDSSTIVSLSGRYRLPMRNDRSWELFATIGNLLDENPPLAPDGAYPTNAAFFDQIGRAFRVGIRADF
jgi:iron complex outermembrane receptor protein